jgi:hypothetical protein
VKNVVSSFADEADRVGLDGLGIEEVDIPTSVGCKLSKHLAVHDRVGSALEGHASLGGDVLGEVWGPRSDRYRRDLFRRFSLDFIQCGGARPADRRSQPGRQLGKSVIVERWPGPVKNVRAPFMVDRRWRQAELDQLDSSAFSDVVAGSGDNSHRPAQVMRNAKPHVTQYARGSRMECNGSRVRRRSQRCRSPATRPARDPAMSCQPSGQVVR